MIFLSLNIKPNLVDITADKGGKYYVYLALSGCNKNVPTLLPADIYIKMKILNHTSFGENNIPMNK